MPKSQMPKDLYRAGSPIDRKIGKNLRYMRETAGLSQSAVAARLGITFQQYQKFESGKNRLPSSRLYMLRALFAVPYERFFEGVDCTEIAENAVDERKKHDLLNARIIRKIKKLDDNKVKERICRMIDVIAA